MRTMQSLKIIKRQFKEVLIGLKKAEIRTIEKDFSLGEVVLLEEVTNCKKRTLTGENALIQVTHVLRDCEFVPEGYQVISFDLLPFKIGKSVDDGRLV